MEAFYKIEKQQDALLLLTASQKTQRILGFGFLVFAAAFILGTLFPDFKLGEPLEMVDPVTVKAGLMVFVGCLFALGALHYLFHNGEISIDATRQKVIISWNCFGCIPKSWEVRFEEIEAVNKVSCLDEQGDPYWQINLHFQDQKGNSKTWRIDTSSDAEYVEILYQEAQRIIGCDGKTSEGLANKLKKLKNQN